MLAGCTSTMASRHRLRACISTVKLANSLNMTDCHVVSYGKTVRGHNLLGLVWSFHYRNPEAGPVVVHLSRELASPPSLSHTSDIILCVIEETVRP
ncbi:hypothetical protein Leryth_026880 [Lithospermum erythrorhizon]|nr:hypothetical protein Leryth_026880 [Lithospermum erythrorhizon]